MSQQVVADHSGAEGEGFRVVGWVGGGVLCLSVSLTPGARGAISRLLPFLTIVIWGICGWPTLLVKASINS